MEIVKTEKIIVYLCEEHKGIGLELVPFESGFETRKYCSILGCLEDAIFYGIAEVKI